MAAGTAWREGSGWACPPSESVWRASRRACMAILAVGRLWSVGASGGRKCVRRVRLLLLVIDPHLVVRALNTKGLRDEVKALLS